MAGLVELLHERELRRCRNSAAYFMENHARIEHPSKGSIPFELFSYQRETLEAFEGDKNVLVLKARQIGYTTVVSIYVLWMCIFHPHKSAVVLSKTQDDAQQIVGKIKHAWNFLPEWMRAALPRTTTDNLLNITWNNGSSVEALASRDEPARGRAVSLMVLDEWAFYNNPGAAWASAMPAADVGGKIIALSTANGAGTLFYEQWVKATTGSSDFLPLFYPWWAREGRDQEWYDRQKRNLLEWQLHQEFPADPEEAFIKSGNAVFDTDFLRKRLTVEPKRGRLEPLNGSKASRFVPEADGNLMVWEFPQKHHRYVVGADVAEGLEHGDYSVAHVIDIKTHDVVAKWRGHIAPDLFGSEVLARLGWYYWGALMGVENNNHGLTTLVALQNTKYTNLYLQTSYDQRTKRRSERLGWRTQVNTKPLLVDELHKWTRGEDPALKIADSETIGELLTFVREGDGKMHGSPFDDQVMSLGIAVQMIKHAHQSFDSKPERVQGTLDWWANQSDTVGEPAVYGFRDLAVRGHG